MARIDYDERTAAAYKASREVPLDGLADWRDAIQRHLRPSAGMTLIDIGAGTGAFSAAIVAWFPGLAVRAVEPSEAMRARIPSATALEVFEGDTMALPLPDDSADGAWMSLMIHHVPDLELAAREIRRVLRPGAPVLIRQGFPDRYEPLGPLRHDGVEMIRWFPETARTADTFPTLAETTAAFAGAGFVQEALEPVRDIRAGTLADFLGQIDTLRTADTTLRGLSDEELLRGKERLRRAVESGNGEPRENWLDLLVLR